MHSAREISKTGHVLMRENGFNRVFGHFVNHFLMAHAHLDYQPPVVSGDMHRNIIAPVAELFSTVGSDLLDDMGKPAIHFTKMT